MKKYTRPEIEISVFATEDIITASDNLNTNLLSEGTAPTNSGVGTDGIDYNDAKWN